MRRTEEEKRLKLGINTTGTTKEDTTTDIYEPEDIPLQKAGVVLRSHSEIGFRTKNEDVRNANKTVAAIGTPTPITTIHVTTSGTREAATESKSNSTPSTSS